MFDYNNIIERAIEYFPSWMDIRKRYKKSKGGKFVQATTQEILSIDEEIQKYIDMYFLDRYEGKEKEIIAFTYKTNIGYIKAENIEQILYGNVSLKIVKDLKDFDINTIYFEDGFLHIREETFKSEYKKIKVFSDGNWGEYVLEKNHVWNVFDEFACFVGLRRHNNETNEELRNRIIYRTSNMPNATEQGLKNAIVSNLMNIVDINENDIEIDKITPEALRKPYEEYEELLDFLSDKNRDVYKDKRWDLDLWKYDFKSIDYIDYKWNEVLKEYKNGVGFNDDLNVIMSNSTLETDANITLYKKSEEKLTEYVHNKKINKDIKFKLERLGNILNAKKLKYKVNASPAVNITNENISMSIYENELKKEKRELSEIYKFASGISSIDMSKITDLNRYQLEFRSLGDMIMQISKCRVIYKNKKTNEVEEIVDLLKRAPGFIFNGDSTLVNTAIKKQVNKINQFNKTEGLQDTSNGIKILNDGIIGKGLLGVSGLGLMELKVEKDYELTNIPKENVSFNPYCFYDEENNIVMRHDVPQDKTITIEIMANTLSFKINSLNNIEVLVQDEDFGFSSNKLSNEDIFKAEYTDKPRNIRVTINAVNISKKTIISDIKYTCHEIDLSLEKGEIMRTKDGKLILPGTQDNSLIVTMKSKSGKSPILKKITIGSGIDNAIYKTEIIQPRSNCDRIFEISSNCQTDLVQVNTYGAEIKRINNYEPSNAYKAVEDNAWIRLDLSEYSSIKNISTNVGSINLIEESGTKFYNVKLKTGDVISNIIIEGIRNYKSKTMSLSDMIRVYLPTFEKGRDKIFCSWLSEGLIVEIFDQDLSRLVPVKISDEVFAGISASKFVINKPSTLNSMFVYGESKIEDYEHSGAFDYISFFPGGLGKNRKSVSANETSLYANEIRNIRYLNNFNPSLSEIMDTMPNDNMLFYYTVTTESIPGVNIEIKFADSSDEKIPFSNLKDFSIGERLIAIRNDINLADSINYVIEPKEIVDEVLLSKYIPIKKEYKLDDGSIIETPEYMVIPPSNMTVEYKHFDGSEKNKYMIKYETFTTNGDRFDKLKYSNIDDLLYIGTEPYSGKDEKLIEEFTLLKNEGVIIWTNPQFYEEEKKIYLRYTIKEPVALVYSTDDLYKEIDYVVDAYDEIKRYKIKSMKENEKYDLRNINEYKDADLVHVLCTEPSFEATLSNNMLRFKKFAEENSIMIKTGFYYINGKEYYLFTEDSGKNLKNKNYIEYHNIEKSGGEIYLHKTTDNYVRNSEMLLRGMNDLYKLDCSKDTVKGVSNFNSLTACDSYNMWTTFEMKIRLSSGINGACLDFTKENPSGYSFIDITEYLSKSSIISLWAEEKLIINIGKEKTEGREVFKDSLNIEIDKEIPYENSSIRETIVIKEDGYKYYLIVTGEGKLDDVIINESNRLISHDKNISLLGLNIKDNRTEGIVYRMNFLGNKYADNKGAAFNKDDRIKITSNINWGITKLKEYSSEEDFNLFKTNNVIKHNNYISTSASDGRIESEPIYIENPLSIKKLFFKINDINFEEMKGMKITFLSSNTKSGSFVPVMYFNENVGYVYGDYLNKYIKIRVDMPANKILNNLTLYAEYKSEKGNAPKVFFNSSGELITKTFDSQENLSYRVKSVDIEEISNINNIKIYIRASKDKYSADVWTEWKNIELDEKNQYKIKNSIIFNDSRFFQIKIRVIGKDSFVKINSIDLEVIK